MDTETKLFITNVFQLSTSLNMSIIGMTGTTDGEDIGLYSLEHNLVPNIQFLLKAIKEYPNHFLSDSLSFHREILDLLNEDVAFIDRILGQQQFVESNPKASKVLASVKDSINKIISYLITN
jgi:hypothetical protein